MPDSITAPLLLAALDGRPCRWDDGWSPWSADMTRSAALTAAVLLAAAPTPAADPPRPVKVFVLAGQSNMEGKAKVALAEYQADQPATRDLYKDWRMDG